MPIINETRWLASKAVGSIRQTLEAPKLRRQAPDAISKLLSQLSFDPHATYRILMGPLNTAGAAHEWMRIASRIPGVDARSVTAEALIRGKFRFKSDIDIPRAAEHGDLTPWKNLVLSSATTVIFESCKPLLGHFESGNFLADSKELVDAGISTGVLLHGSDIRNKELHQAEVSHSLFNGRKGPYWREVASNAKRNRSLLNQFQGKIFVSTPGLVSHVPGSIWLPLVINSSTFATTNPLLQRDIPVVAHAPSNPRFKGTEQIEPVLYKLQEEGLIHYRPMQGIPHSEMPTFLANSDIVIDQITLGDTGVQVAETMAAGRIAIANVTPQTRATIGTEIPLVQADPTTLEEQLRKILKNRDLYRELASHGPAYVESIHGGKRSQDILKDAFNLSL